MGSVILRSGWLENQIKAAQEELKTWPDWVRESGAEQIRGIKGTTDAGSSQDVRSEGQAMPPANPPH